MAEALLRPYVGPLYVMFRFAAMLWAWQTRKRNTYRRYYRFLVYKPHW
jgi:hypothetical protein